MPSEAMVLSKLKQSLGQLLRSTLSCFQCMMESLATSSLLRAPRYWQAANMDAKLGNANSYGL